MESGNGGLGGVKVMALILSRVPQPCSNPVARNKKGVMTFNRSKREVRVAPWAVGREPPETLRHLSRKAKSHFNLTLHTSIICGLRLLRKVNSYFSMATIMPVSVEVDEGHSRGLQQLLRA